MSKHTTLGTKLMNLEWSQSKNSKYQQSQCVRKHVRVEGRNMELVHYRLYQVICDIELDAAIILARVFQSSRFFM